MSRRSLLVRLGVALVAVVAIAFAAATIDDPVEPGGDGGFGGDGEGDEPLSEPGAPVEVPAHGEELPAFLEYLFVIVPALLALFLAWYLVFHRRDAIKLLAVGACVVLFAFLIAHFLSTGEVPVVNQSVEGMGAPNETEAGEPGSGEGTADAWPTGTILAILGVVAAIFVATLLMTRNGGADAEAFGEVEPEEDDDEAAAVAAAAGRAAERIESSDEEDVDNEVYRAWRNMTRLLDVDRPETSTPGEFADAAVDSGLEPDHVDELTRLFEDVRYGHEETTAEMERRAVTVLRRIEASYGDDGTDGDRP